MTGKARLTSILSVIIVFLAACAGQKPVTLNCSNVSIAVATRIGGVIRTGTTQFGTQHSEPELDGKCFWSFDGVYVTEVPCTPMENVIVEDPEDYVRHFRVWRMFESSRSGGQASATGQVASKEVAAQGGTAR